MMKGFGVRLRKAIRRLFRPANEELLIWAIQTGKVRMSYGNIYPAGDTVHFERFGIGFGVPEDAEAALMLEWRIHGRALL